MNELVFLLEERSAQAMLDSLLPRFLHKTTQYRCIPFEGKNNLEKEMTRKIKLYQNQHARFIVLRDQDIAPDCMVIKRRLLHQCEASGKQSQCRVRIACRELESFYLADLDAVELALGITGLAKQQNKRKFRAPDALHNPSRELKALTKNNYNKISGSRAIGQHLKLDNTRSSSFRALIAVIRTLEAELLHNNGIGVTE